MMRLCLAAVGVLTVGALLSLGCGGPAKKAAPPTILDGGPGDAGDHHDASEPADAGAGGAGGAGGADRTPPAFGGAVKVDTSEGEDRVVVSWGAASDLPHSPDGIAYRVYRSSTSHGEDYSRARRCDEGASDSGGDNLANLPCYVATGAGATSAVVRDATPAHTFYYVVRAVDSAGNEDGNTVEVSATTPDLSPPDFGGVRSVAAVTATSIKVTWGAGFDLGTPDSSLVFHVFVSASTAPDPSKDKPAYTSKPGERATIITGLDPSTPYKVIVRAFDQAGHSDSNARVLSVTTPEGIAPTFDGARRASAEGTAIRLFWSQASDNVTSPPTIVYDIYQSLRQNQEKFTNPPAATSAPGASSILIAGLQSGTRYYYVVRARDFAQNEDVNTKEVSASTPVPDTLPPTFGGADTVIGSTPTSITIKWTTANDDLSLNASDFTYTIYASMGMPNPSATPSLTVRGVTSATLIGLNPGTNYNVLVVAQDAAGNKNTGSGVQTGATLAVIAGDTTPPQGGTPTAVQVVSTPTRLNVSWPAATDDTYDPAVDVRYHVCASTTAADCLGASFSQHVLATTAFGVKTASLLFLKSHTSYFIDVRAEDRSGNVETIDHFAAAAVTTATSWTNDVRQILFDRCVACHNFDTPSAIVNVISSFTDESNRGCPTFVPDGGCQLKFVDPTFPEFSYIYRKVNPAGITTPPFSATVRNVFKGLHEPRDVTEPLSVDEDETLFSWIKQGALGN